MGFFDLFKRKDKGKITEKYNNGFKRVYKDGTIERVKHTKRGDVSYFDGPNGKVKIGPWH